MAGPKRFLRVDTTDPVFDVVYEIARAQYPGSQSGPGTVLRELCITALASTDLTSAPKATARRLAYLDGIAYVRQHLGRALSDMGATLLAEGAATDALIAAERATMTGEAE